jgi:hypothetical protein
LQLEILELLLKECNKLQGHEQQVSYLALLLKELYPKGGILSFFS